MILDMRRERRLKIGIVSVAWMDGFNDFIAINANISNLMWSSAAFDENIQLSGMPVFRQ